MNPQQIFEEWFKYKQITINEFGCEIGKEIKKLVEDARRTAENNNYDSKFIDEYVKEHSYIFED